MRRNISQRQFCKVLASDHAGAYGQRLMAGQCSGKSLPKNCEKSVDTDKK